MAGQNERYMFCKYANNVIPFSKILCLSVIEVKQTVVCDQRNLCPVNLRAEFYAKLSFIKDRFLKVMNGCFFFELYDSCTRLLSEKWWIAFNIKAGYSFAMDIWKDHVSFSVQVRQRKRTSKVVFEVGPLWLAREALSKPFLCRRWLAKSFGMAVKCDDYGHLCQYNFQYLCYSHTTFKSSYQWVYVFSKRNCC